MKKAITVMGIVFAASLFFAACSQRTTITRDLDKLEQEATELQKELDKDPFEEESTGTDTESLEKDLGNMKLEEETFE